MKKLPALFVRCLFLLFIIAITLSVDAYGQSFRVSGTIKNESGEPLHGVTVRVKNTGNITVSDSLGHYVLNASSAQQVIEYTFVGFEPFETAVKGRSQINVTMSLAANSLTDVVVIGYGQVERKDLTGAISTVKPRKQDAIQFQSVDGLLRGRAAGVQVTSNNGAPGSVSSVRIRGTNSLRSDNEPLYVVDGLIVNTATNDVGNGFSISGVAGSGNAGQEKQNGLTGINTQDIESIEVLKDASATAIYGSRGANGVVIITTKQGKAGNATIDFSANTEFMRANKTYDVLDGRGYAEYANKINEIRGLLPLYNPDTVRSVNWQDELFGTGITQTYRLSARGGSVDKGSNYYIAGGYLKSDGIVENTGLSQGDLKLNLKQKLSKKFTMSFTFSSLYRVNNMTTGTEPLGGVNTSFISQAVIALPFRNLSDDVNNADSYANPLSWTTDYDDISKEFRFQGTLSLDYAISKSFSYRLNVGGDVRNKERSRWYGYNTYQGSLVRGSLGINNLSRNYYLVENLLMYKKTINKDHKIDATVGVTYDQENGKTAATVNENFFSEELRTDGLGYGSSIYLGVPDRYRIELFSVLARLNYTYKNKYLVTLSGRADGSSKFKDDNKFGYFPSASLAWRLSNERFMKNIDYLSDLKLRVGFGVTGNQSIAPYNTFARYGSSVYPNPGGGLLVGVAAGNIENDNLKWESTQQVNAGMDVGILNNRITFNVDAYYKKTTDLLQSFALPYSTGFATITKNFGTLENKGIEFTVNGTIIDNENFKWSADANIGINRNRILDLGLPSAKLGTMNDQVYYLGNAVSNSPYFKDPANVFINGSPLGLFYGFQTNGVYQNAQEAAGNKFFGANVVAGDLRLVDQNGDKNITDDDKVILGNPNPDFTYGFSTNFQFKNFSLYMFFNGSYGNDVVNGNMMRLTSPDGQGTNILKSAYESAWTATNPTNNPRLNYSSVRFIDRLVEDGSFLRMSTISLGYLWKRPGASFLKQMSFNVTGRNLLLLTSYSGYDPEVNSFSFDPNRIGVDWNSYPNTKGITFSINITL